MPAPWSKETTRMTSIGIPVILDRVSGVSCLGAPRHRRLFRSPFTSKLP